MKEKLIIRMLVLNGIILTLLSCSRKENSCDPPLGINYNNLDWTDYNDVWTVYANNNLGCSDPRVVINNGKDIQIYGWLIKNANEINITDSLCAFKKYCNSGLITVYYTPEMQTFFDACDLTKKCYLKGELKLEQTVNEEGSWCCQFSPYIVLKSIDNIYFEEE